MPILKTLQRALKAERGKATIQALSDSETVLANHHCNDCGTEVWANHMTEAHCPVCASHDMKVISTKGRKITPEKVEAAISDEVLAHLGTCTTCETSFVGNPALALAGHMHCTVCGTHMAIAMDDAETGDDSDMETDEDESEEVEEYDDSDMETDEDESEEVDDFGDEESEDEVEAKVTKRKKASKRKALAELADSALPNAMDGSTDLIPVDPEAEILKGEQSTLAPQEVAASKTQFKVNLLKIHAARMNKGELPIAFTKHGGTNRWLVTAGNVTVATTNPDKVANHLKGIYPTAKFCLAFETALQNNGLTEEVEKNFGLEPVVIEQPIPVAVAEMVTDQINQIKEEYADKLDQVNDHAEQTIDIAMCKIAKGLNGKPNALRIGLINALAANGVEQPQALVDKVFAENMGPFISDTMEEAKILQEKSPESINEISDLTAKAAYSPVEITEGAKLQSALQKKLPVHSESVHANVTNIAAPRRNVWKAS